MIPLRYVIFLLCTLLQQASGEGRSVKYHNCKSEFTIKEVRVDPCPNSDGTRCPLKKGTSPTVSVTFIPNKPVANLTATVHGIIKTIPTEFDLPNKNACANSNINCPLVAGQEYTYAQSVQVMSSYPSLSLLIRWSLDSQAATGDTHDICFIIRANIVD